MSIFTQRLLKSKQVAEVARENLGADTESRWERIERIFFKKTTKLSPHIYYHVCKINRT